MVQRSRLDIAERFGVAPKAVFFTSGATEGNAWVLSGTSLPVVASAVEHPSVLAWASETVPVDSAGTIDLEALETRLAQEPAMVSVMAANNETGVIQPMNDVVSICRKYGAALHCDATQVFGRMDFDVDADFITVSAHKLGGPRGIGALISKSPPDSILRGGKQERGHRAGTLNGPGIAGFAAAVRLGETWPSTERDTLEQFCRAKGGRIVGDAAARLPNTLSVLFDQPGDVLVAALDLKGIYASTGSACSSGSSQSSHVLDAMGLTGTPLRFSFGPDSRAQPAIDALEEILTQMEAACV